MSVRALAILAIPWLVISPRSLADDLLYRYEGDVLHYDESAGWLDGGCEDPCSESLENGHFVLRWTRPGDLANYHLWISRAGDPPPPPTLWVEWRFRSNHPIGPNFYTCDGWFTLDFRAVHDLVFMYGDTAISFSGDYAVFGLAVDDFHTYRFDSLDGVNYTFSVDGLVFVDAADHRTPGGAYLQLGGGGGCEPFFNTVNEWDFVRYGTISYGEQIISSHPPDGLLDARNHAPLDRVTVTFDSPNYVYIDEVTVTVTGGDVPVVTQTRRRENDGPETVEIVLDRPIPMGETTRCIFDDGVAVNVVEYTFAPGDTDGDGDADLHDFAVFQRCFGFTDLTGACLALDFNADNTIDLSDYDAFEAVFAKP